MELSLLSFEQMRLVFVVYVSSLLPVFLIPYLHFKNKIPGWCLRIYILFFFVCAFGWELWFNYGIFSGDNVNLRRAEILSYFLPININWLLNSLADSGTICLGGLYIALKINKNESVLHSWNWNFFFVLLIIFISQNLFVELFLYHDQLSIGKAISWAPMSPFGYSFNPILFSLKDRTVSLQGQMPWIIMTPIFYKSLILYVKKYK